VVIGRADDVVVSGGVKVALPAVTQALTTLPGVTDAVAVGVPDAEWGTRVVAVGGGCQASRAHRRTSPGERDPAAGLGAARRAGCAGDAAATRRQA
jgi:hypothetical protein